MSYSMDLQEFALVADHEKVRKTYVSYYDNFPTTVWREIPVI